MAMSLPSNPTPQNVAALLPKLSDADSDFRFMSLNDLYTLLSNGQPGFLVADYNTAARAVDGVLKTLDDQNGEVQNLAIKCLGPLSLKIPSSILCPLLEKISKVTTEHSVDSSIPSTALRTVVTALPRPVSGMPISRATQDAYSAISKVLIPRLVGYNVVPPMEKNLPHPPPGMLTASEGKNVEGDAVDVVVETVRCFGPMLQDLEVRALQRAVMDLLESERTGSVVKKRAVVAISVLAVYFRDDHLGSFVSELIESLRNSHLTAAKRRLLITITGSLARSIPLRFGPYLQTLGPFIFSAVSQEELDDQISNIGEDEEQDHEIIEVREAALVAIESFLASCSSETRAFTNEIIESATRFLRYDPNFTDIQDDEEMSGTQNQDEEDEEDFDNEDIDQDEDFEEEGGFSDDDDISWKVRRCAAKVLYTLIATRASGELLEDGTLYEAVAPVLVQRFKEREENVRLEILAAMAALVQRTGHGAATSSTSAIDDSHSALMGPPHSRKRRRGGSDASMFDTQASVSLSAGLTSPLAPPIPTSGPQASLSELSPAIVRSVTKLLKGSAASTKQASLALLKDIVAVQHGGLSEYLHQIIEPVIDAIKTPSTSSGATTTVASAGATSATGATLRIAALNLAAIICETHASSVLHPHLGKLVPAITLAVQDKFYKVSSEALNAVEQLVKVFTPPRCHTTGAEQQQYLQILYDVIFDRVTANDADLEVRQRAIHALGILLGRTSGPEGAKLFSQEKRFAALDILYDRLRNEITRISAVRAVDTVASLATSKTEFSAAWTRNTSLELGAQLRKANRALRAASLGALKNLVTHPAGHANLDGRTTKELVEVLSPLLSANDLHLLGPTLVVLTSLVKGNAKKVVDASMISSLCSLVLAPLGGAVLDALLILVKTIGEEGVGKLLMQDLLKEVGVNGEPAVVGKMVGTLLVYGGKSVGVTTDDFVSELRTAKDDQRKCLALSVLGEAGLRLGKSSSLSPNLFIEHFRSKSDQVPLAAAVALGRAGAGNVETYLPVILETMNTAKSSQYLLLHSIKEILQQASDAETDIGPYSKQIWESVAVTAQLEDNKANYLDSNAASVRGMAIQAIRYTLSDTDESYDSVLRPILVEMLTTMLKDTDLENRRLALTTLNSAMHNKGDLLAAHVGQLLPLVMKETRVRPELVREVQMGPFKHKVDDGLELRKSAYETLYVLMEAAFTRMNVVELFDRVIAGLEDEHDVRVLCSVMLTKLILLDPEETTRRLDAISESFRSILSFKPKESAVKQELEKADEAKKGVLRVSVKLNSAFPNAAGSATSGQNQLWRNYWEWVRKDFGAQLKAIEEENVLRSD
ncbi:MAG: hypothetical protein M1833_003795 [Piccolia ochrophora]|nr:MAG: hypothetical protein M1833_003795 [Piccolia ochrophora]